MTLFTTKKHLYNDDEVKSAIQKTIRRGDEEGALFFALELAHEGKPSFGWLRNHLKIIAYEDIGIANPDVVLQVSKAVDDMDFLYESNNEEWEMSLAYIILLLSRSKKSRITDHFKIYVKRFWEDNSGKVKVEIPNYALDYHTTRGNELGRTKHTKKGIDHFIKEGEKLTNGIEDIYKEKAHRVWREKCQKPDSVKFVVEE